MPALANRPDLVQDILVVLNAKHSQLSHSTSSLGKKKSRVHEDSVYMVNFLRGICYSHLNQVEKACDILSSVAEAWVPLIIPFRSYRGWLSRSGFPPSEKDIVEDKFLPPHAAIELAYLKLRMDDLTGAMQYCVKAM